MFEIRLSAPLSWLASFIAWVRAALLADPSTESLEAPWKVLAARVKSERDDLEKAQFSVLVARAKIAVLDVKSDAAITDLSGRAFLAAGKDDKAPPYIDLFDGVKAEDVRDFGPGRVTVFVGRVLATLAALNHADLAKPQAVLAELNPRLKAANEERNGAIETVGGFDTRRRQLIEAIEQQIALTVIDLLKLEPGNKALVRAVLSPGNLDKKEADEKEPTPPTA